MMKGGLAGLMKQAQARQRRGMAPDLSTLEVWDSQFCALSAQLTCARAALVERLREPVARAYDEVATFQRTGGAEGLPSIRIGRCLRVPKRALLAWIDAQLGDFDAA